MRYPVYRPRRLRRNENLRRLVRETRLSVDNLIMPLFVVPGSRVRNPVPSMPGVAQLSVDRAVEECKEVRDLGVPGVILFGVPESKDALGSQAYSDEGIVQRALRRIKEDVPGLLLVTDVCFCEYTDHGHCGIVRGGEVDNDATVHHVRGGHHVGAGARV